ncbi:preprotein translocase subunit YajC [bacterium]|nr:preprotein translocase subunit YajC [bacterium]
MLGLFISTAYAQEAGAAAASGGGFGAFMPLVVVFAIFYFLIIRPQQKQQKKMRQMIADAKKGDEVITNSGLHGKIVELKDNNVVMLQVANNVVMKFERSSIQHIKGYETDDKKKQTNQLAKKNKAA